MAVNIPSGLLEACVVVGASTDSLRELYQGKNKEHILLEAEVLQVHAPPFVTKESESDLHHSAFSRVPKRRSFLKKKRERPVVSSSNGTKDTEPVISQTDDLSVPKDIDLIALPQLCFPDGLKVVTENQEDSYHFLVFTDVFGNQTHGVVAQYYRSLQFCQDSTSHQNGQRSSKSPRLYTAYGVCVISKYPYYNALRDCLSSFVVRLKTCRMVDFEEQVKEFSAKLALVPIPPPGQLQVAFSLKPLEIVLPPREDMDRRAVDLDLHLPFLCFRPEQILQVICSILTEQRVVFFSSDWASLTLVAESFMFFIHPLRWQHPFVPVLSRQMLDFLMAPTAYLMGCHIHHFEDVASETEDLILIGIDDGTVSSTCTVDLPEMPLISTECFKRRVEGLHLHYDLELCRRGSTTDMNELRGHRRQWQRKLNSEILSITLELIVNIFRDVHDHLNYEHRVFNSEEFLRSQDPADQPFYKKVLETHIFHSFLRERLNRKMDAFAHMEINTRTEAYRFRAMSESPRRPTMQEMARKYTGPENRLSKRLGMSLPNLVEDRSLTGSVRQLSLMKGTPQRDRGVTNRPDLKLPTKPIKTFKLPEFPPPLAFHYVQNYYCDLINQLNRVITATSPEDSSLLARYYYLRGLVNSVAGKRLDALSDFQNLYRTDMDIFPVELVTALVDSLQVSERSTAEKRPELKRLISRVKKSSEQKRLEDGGSVKKFELPRKHMLLEDFVRRVQESGIVKDQGTITRLFDALTVGQQKQVDPEIFRFFYTIWKETEAEAQEVDLPTSVLNHLETNECVYKISSSVKTSHGVGKIAMTQRRLFLLTEGHPGYLEVTKFRDIEEVKISSAPFLLLRIPSLKIKTSRRRETFEANLKSECELWHLMIKEMWAGRKMSDEHKDPQYVQQSLTNALLMDAVVGCLQSPKSIYSASKLAYFDKMKNEVPLMVPKTTSETLKHKINPCLNLPSPQAVDILLYTPGQLGADGSGYPKLWCALRGGKVMVFDAASWSMQPNGVQVGSSRLNCMLGVDHQQLWIGSQDSVIYIINPHSMACNKQLTEHRAEVTGLALDDRPDKFSQLMAYSCSAEGTVIAWDVPTLQVKHQFRLCCEKLQSIQVHNRRLWCCGQDCVMEVRRNGTLQRKIALPDHLRGSPSFYNSFVVFNEREQLWTGCINAGELCVWHLSDMKRPFQRMQLSDCAGVVCMIKVKNKIWVGCHGHGGAKTRGKIYVIDTERHQVEKELVAHSDSVQTLCSAEDRYILSGAAGLDGKIAIWKVE
ncbi:DENN domain-containing protein 3 isoform X2 [Hoplias malabaricus]|uniref:DENN domain-containing protein 3 isoform X2 n=1 Tax=Hoplias malabaricus TaxID=27720 RepID=UPI00346325EE